MSLAMYRAGLLTTKHVKRIKSAAEAAAFAATPGTKASCRAANGAAGPERLTWPPPALAGWQHPRRGGLAWAGQPLQPTSSLCALPRRPFLTMCVASLCLPLPSVHPKSLQVVLVTDKADTPAMLKSFSQRFAAQGLAFAKVQAAAAGDGGAAAVLASLGGVVDSVPVLVALGPDGSRTVYAGTWGGCVGMRGGVNNRPAFSARAVACCAVLCSAPCRGGPCCDCGCALLRCAGQTKAPQILDWLKQLAGGGKKADAAGGSGEAGAGKEAGKEVPEGGAQEGGKDEKQQQEEKKEVPAEIPQVKRSWVCLSCRARHASPGLHLAGWALPLACLAHTTPLIVPCCFLSYRLSTLSPVCTPRWQVVANVTAAELTRRLEKDGVVVAAFYRGAALNACPLPACLPPPHAAMVWHGPRYAAASSRAGRRGSAGRRSWRRMPPAAPLLSPPRPRRQPSPARTHTWLPLLPPPPPPPPPRPPSTPPHTTPISHRCRVRGRVSGRSEQAERRGARPAGAGLRHAGAACGATGRVCGVCVCGWVYERESKRHAERVCVCACAHVVAGGVIGGWVWGRKLAGQGTELAGRCGARRAGGPPTNALTTTTTTTTITTTTTTRRHAPPFPPT